MDSFESRKPQVVRAIKDYLDETESSESTKICIAREMFSYIANNKELLRYTKFKRAIKIKGNLF